MTLSDFFRTNNKPWVFNLWLVLFLIAPNLVFAAAEVRRSVSAEDRVDQLEKQLETANRMRAELQFQVTTLQNEVRQLRGLVEEQTYQIEQITNRQRELYKNLDQLSGAGAAQPEPKISDRTPVANTNTGQTATTGTVAAHKTPEEIRAEYDNIFPLVRNKRYDEAIFSYQKFIADYPDNEYVSYSRYWLAQIYSVLGRAQDSESEYLLVAQQYPDSPKAAESWLKLGQLYENQSDTERAISAYRQLLDSYPTSNAAKFAKGRLQALQ